MDERCQEHAHRLTTLENSVGEMRIELTSVKKDTEYIKQRLDNGLFSKLDDIRDKVQEIAPQVRSNTAWVQRFQFGLIIVFIGSILSGIFLALFKTVLFRNGTS